MEIPYCSHNYPTNIDRAYHLDNFTGSTSKLSGNNIRKSFRMDNHIVDERECIVQNYRVKTKITAFRQCQLSRS